MTEQEWLDSSTTEEMLNFVKGKTTERKLRLFSVACCREILHLIKDKRISNAVEAAEKFADKLISKDELNAARAAARDAAGYATREAAWSAAWAATGNAAGYAAGNAAWYAAWDATSNATSNAAWDAAQAEQANILRDIFGNPFRQVFAKNEWLSWNDGVVSRMAESIYWGRTWDELPILADALEEVGCDSTEILSSLRRQEKHYRGYWVLDLLTGKH